MIRLHDLNGVPPTITLHQPFSTEVSPERNSNTIAGDSHCDSKGVRLMSSYDEELTGEAYAM